MLPTDGAMPASARRSPYRPGLAAEFGHYAPSNLGSLKRLGTDLSVRVASGNIYKGQDLAVKCHSQTKSNRLIASTIIAPRRPQFGRGYSWGYFRQSELS